jgi:hypothetical protein
VRLQEQLNCRGCGVGVCEQGVASANTKTAAAMLRPYDEGIRHHHTLCLRMHSRGGGEKGSAALNGGDGTLKVYFTSRVRSRTA